MKIKKSLIPIKLFLIASLLLLGLTGCGTGGDGDDETTSENISIFNERAPGIIDKSLFDLPKSLADISQDPPPRTSRRSVKFEPQNESEESSGDHGGIYEGVSHYVAMAAMMEEHVKNWLKGFFDGIEKASLAEELITYPLVLSESDDDFEKLTIYHPGWGGYDWTLSFYELQEDETPDAVFSFTIKEEGAKGHVTIEMSESDDDATSALGLPADDITVDMRLEITFEAVQNHGEMEIKFFGDRTDASENAAANWSSLDDEQKEALTGAPEKVFLTAVSDETEIDRTFSIWGTSYHPGWNLRAELDGEDYFWGDPLRNMYMFKATAWEPTGDNTKEDTPGAKVYVALPKNTTENTTNVWTDDSIGNLFTGLIVDEINDMLVEVGDPTADNICNWITGSPNCGGDDEISRQELLTFIDDLDPPDNSDEQDFYDVFRSIAYMINPAFFLEDEGFVGTYDETLTPPMRYIYYDQRGFVDATDDTSQIQHLIDLPMGNITDYVPADVTADDLEFNY